MAWEPLPTDYTDAVWDGYKKFRQISNTDGTVSFEDVTEYSQKEKSFFGANDANRMNEAINDLMEKTGTNKTVSRITSTYKASTGVFWGDALNDGVINQDDVDAVYRYIVGLGNISVAACDLDGDGQITNVDANILTSLVRGIGRNQVILRTDITYSDGSIKTHWGYTNKPEYSSDGSSGGVAGVGIYDISFNKEDADGNYVYTITLDDGKKYNIICPRGASYTLPIASASTLGGVKPVAKTDEMTAPIGVDADGGLWGLPPGAGGATPVRGVDYWTAEDIATIKSYVDDAILGGAWK